ncbi:MAG: YdcF family protein, partial [Phaeodactylibacter sp.]|nr:YdcF family protein [Phaeodactylibacter sp.]
FEVADEIVVLLDRLEIPDSAIIEEGRSLNTYENIINSKQLIDSLQPDAKILLFTSAFHMPRALAICKKQGLSVTPYPTDIMYNPLSWAPRDWLFPDSGGFHIWSLFLKEWVGYVVYKLKGYA